MKKIPSLFERNWNHPDRPLLSNYSPEGSMMIKSMKKWIATRKWDGTACAIIDGRLYKRYDAKVNSDSRPKKAPPGEFVPCGDPDPVTGHWPGWVPIDTHDYWHHEAWERLMRYYLGIGSSTPPDWTYELCGPKINGNPEGLPFHALIPHGRTAYSDAPVKYDELCLWLQTRTPHIEGLVWWENGQILDSRKVKIKMTDFGVKRTPVPMTEEETHMVAAPLVGAL